MKQRIALALGLAVLWLERLRDLGKPKTIEQVRGWASLELLTNPTITEYRFANGVEIDRRAANPLTKLGPAMEQMKRAFERFGDQMLLSMAKIRLGQPES